MLQMYLEAVRPVLARISVAAPALAFALPFGLFPTFSVARCRSAPCDCFFHLNLELYYSNNTTYR